jgi:CRISPR-associated exonuclease Cas4
MQQLTVSALQHLAYCPRKCALMVVDGIWMDNEHTIRGSRGHRRADRRFDRVERGVRVVRAVPVHSDRLGLTGRADVVEIHPDGRICPVEYKMGRRVKDTADLQLCALAMCLEEMSGQDIAEGAVWYGGPRRRERVVFSTALRQKVVDSVSAIRKMFESEHLPPAPADQRCVHCQFEPICLPDIVSAPDRVSAYLASSLGEVHGA